MKHNVAVIVVLLIFTVNALAAQNTKAKITKEYFDSAGKKRTYYLYVPEIINEVKAAPLLMTLHGSGRDGKSQIEQWKELAKKEGFIVVAPDAINSMAWQMPLDGPDFLFNLIESLKKKYSINERRIYLFGHSAGANFGLLMGLLESEYFAATAVHAGAIQKDSHQFIERAKRKIPIAIFVGDRDTFFPVALIIETKDALKAKGNTPEVTILKNHDHNYYSLAPKLNPMIWDFIKSKELADAPRYEHYDIR